MMELSDLIKTIPLVPQFQGILRDLRNLTTRFGQLESDVQSVDLSRLEAKLEDLNERFRALERTVQELQRRKPHA